MYFLPNKDYHTDSDYVDVHTISGLVFCPPEDVGGVDCYADMLKSLTYMEDDERESCVKWLGREFDQEFFGPLERQYLEEDFQLVIGEAR